MESFKDKIKSATPYIAVIVAGVILCCACTLLIYNTEGFLKPIVGIVALFVTIIMVSLTMGYITVMRRQTKALIKYNEMTTSFSNRTYLRDKAKKEATKKQTTTTTKSIKTKK